MRVAYLGPEGSFTHEAALQWSDSPEIHEFIPHVSVDDVVAAVSGQMADRGVIAIENTVEGYVVPALEALVNGSTVVAVDEVTVDISFAALVHPGHGELTQITAHPHALAQCRSFISQWGLPLVAASSNSAACRDLSPGQIALAPYLCSTLYGLEALAREVEDFQGARTRFLVVERRHEAVKRTPPTDVQWRTMLAVTPTSTGPGVLARISATFGDCGVNLSSLITRPVKAVEGTYVFIVTADIAPWEPRMKQVLRALLEAGDHIKTLGVMPRRQELDEHVHRDVQASQVPVGSVADISDAEQLRWGLLW